LHASHFAYIATPFIVSAHYDHTAKTLDSEQ